MMSFKKYRLQDRDLDKVFQIVLSGLEENAELDVKREIVNSILPVDKYTLLHRFLSENEGLSTKLRLNSLPVFLDERTKYFSFVQYEEDQQAIKSILSLIPKYCPNIKTVDLRNLVIKSEIKENFKTFLKETTQMKSLRMSSCQRRCSCAIFELLLEDDFHLHDRDVQNGLLKIEYFDGWEVFDEFMCANLLKRLPNLKSFGPFQDLDSVISTFSDDDEIVQKLNNITEIGEDQTTLINLEYLAKFCPKAEKIHLCEPEKNVIKNLCKFEFLSELILFSEDSDFLSEVIYLLSAIGKQIKTLHLAFAHGIDPDPKIFHYLCPKLITLTIKHGISEFHVTLFTMT